MSASQICVARIGAAHGVRGAVKLWTFTEDPLAVTRYDGAKTRDAVQTLTLFALRAVGVADARARGLVVQTALPPPR